MNGQPSIDSTRSTFTHDGIAFGCDYNPEQWAPETWNDDAALMREAGVDLVAINIFGWADIERSPGQYDFTNLDTIIELLHANGIRVNLGTGTSSPPPWLTTMHPEILPVMEDGTVRYPGGRQAWCPSSPVFREHALALVEKVAERYGAHPAIAIWHVSNELGCHNALCFDEDSAAAFRVWLERKYETIDALNAAWGTTFWSQRYGAWDQVLPPRLTVSTKNPSQLVDFQRFSSDELLDYYRSEAEVIRAHSTIPVTTNFMVTAHIRNLDYFQWAPEMDIIANDHYLDYRLPNPTAELSFSADLTRGLAEGGRWLLMEHSTGSVNWQPVNYAKLDGEMTRNSLTHVARGAEAVCFFQWRASQQGSEKFHSSLVPHAGTDTKMWRDVVELGAVMDRLGEVAGTRVESRVAIIFSWESWWSHDGESRPSQAVTYLDRLHAAHSALRDLGITADVVSPDADLSGYELVVIPNLYMVRDDQAARIDDYVSAGGNVVVTFFSGIADEDDRVRLGGYPGAFRDLLGVTVEEFLPVRPGTSLELDTGATAELWTERLRVTTATPLARYLDGPVPGTPAITRNQRGAGSAWYIATALDASSMRNMLAGVTTELAIAPADAAASGTVEIVRRSANDRSYLFVINHGETAVDVATTGHDLVTDTRTGPTTHVPAGTVRVVREDTPS